MCQKQGPFHLLKARCLQIFNCRGIYARNREVCFALAPQWNFVGVYMWKITFATNVFLSKGIKTKEYWDKKQAHLCLPMLKPRKDFARVWMSSCLTRLLRICWKCGWLLRLLISSKTRKNLTVCKHKTIILKFLCLLIFYNQLQRHSVCVVDLFIFYVYLVLVTIICTILMLLSFRCEL